MHINQEDLLSLWSQNSLPIAPLKLGITTSGHVGHKRLAFPEAVVLDLNSQLCTNIVHHPQQIFTKPLSQLPRTQNGVPSWTTLASNTQSDEENMIVTLKMNVPPAEWEAASQPQMDHTRSSNSAESLFHLVFIALTLENCQRRLTTRVKAASRERLL